MRDPIQISQVARRAVVRLKSWAAPSISRDKEGHGSVEDMARLVPPGLGGQVRVLSIAPGDSFMVSDSLPGEQLSDRLRKHLEGCEIAVVDLSCALKVLRVEGVAARELLSKGCGLDLHPRAFSAGQMTRTRFAELAVIIDCVDPSPRFELYLGRSFLAWLHAWLVDAAVEFQVR